MKQTREILKQLEERYSSIDYYNILIDEIETNVTTNPDIAIESCKAILEGMAKYIWKQIDPLYNADIANSMDFHPLFKKSAQKLAEFNEDVETDFINKANKLIVSIGEVRNKRGDISHGKLSPKEYFSDAHFSNLVVNMTDNLLYYILGCFAKVSPVKELSYEDNQDFNIFLDAENEFGDLSYSLALFQQDIERYKQELLNYQDIEEIL